ncbi:hypothetical protein [Streptomyces sp. 8N706]|uniref:hypothetical protein n=1 Tax=Streptomyces sp. 8N706 TaxID=3457416 RepID=UPI003FD68E5F
MTKPGSSGAHSGRYEETSHYTVFNAKRGKELKAMLDGTSVSSVKEVARHWQVVHDELVGEDGNGGIKKDFDEAVKKVMKTWHGESANKFLRQSQKISENFRRGAPYAQDVANAMGQAADDLQKAIDSMGSIDWSPMRGSGSAQENAELAIQKHIEKGGGQLSYEYVADQEGDPDGLRSIMIMVSPGVALFTDEGNLEGKIKSYNGVQADLASGMSTEAVLKKWDDVHGDLGLPKFVRQDLESAVAMEKLGTSYVAQSSKLEVPKGAKDDEIPERPNGGGGGGGGNIGGGAIGGGIGGIGKGGAKMPSGGKGIGIGGRDPISLKPPTGTGRPRPGSQIGTGLDGVTTGPTKVGSGGGLGGGSLGVGSSGGGAGGGGVGALGGGGSLPIGGAGGMGGARTGATGTGRTGAGGAGRGGVGSAGTGKSGTGAGSGRAGLPGMAGGAGAGAGAGQGGGTGRGGSSMARRAGGTVGSPGGKSSSGAAQGGSGLHRSRGGSEAGQSRGGRGAGMAGAPGAHGANGGRDGQGGQRPDYLTEEEETWLPQRNVAPRVIE